MSLAVPLSPPTTETPPPKKAGYERDRVVSAIAQNHQRVRGGGVVGARALSIRDGDESGGRVDDDRVIRFRTDDRDRGRRGCVDVFDIGVADRKQRCPPAANG